MKKKYRIETKEGNILPGEDRLRQKLPHMNPKSNNVTMRRKIGFTDVLHKLANIKWQYTCKITEIERLL